MEIIKRYFDNIHALLEMVIDTQSDAIHRAVTAAADTLEQGGMIYAFGTGHSHMLAEELFYRDYLEKSPMVASATFVDNPNANAVGYHTMAEAQLSLKGI